jgi:hypothetical protein
MQLRVVGSSRRFEDWERHQLLSAAATSIWNSSEFL